MRILVVSQYFWPENFRINDLCDELSKRGCQITVLTGKPNYPSGTVFPDYKKNPREFNSFRGVEIKRVPIIYRGTGRGLRLILNYLSFVVSASTIGIWKLRRKRFDVIFVYEPSPVTVCLPAIFYKKIYKTPVVFWVLDLWPETLESLGVVTSKRLLAWVGILVEFIYRNCDLVLGQSKGFIGSIAKYCSNEDKIKYFPSWSEEIFSTDEERGNFVFEEDNGVFRVLFAGNVGESQDFASILRAAEQIRDKQLKVRIHIVGDGRMSNWLKEQIKLKKLDKYISLEGRHPLEMMPKFYQSAHALLATLKESEAFSMTIPGKIQTYMLAGKPILTMLTGEGSRVIDEAGCGFTANAGDYQTLAKNIEVMSKLKPEDLQSMGMRGREYARREFDRTKLISQLQAWFEDLSIAETT